MSVPNSIKTGRDVQDISSPNSPLNTFLTVELAKGNAILDFAAKLHKTYLVHLTDELEITIPNEKERVDKLEQIWQDSIKIAIIHLHLWYSVSNNHNNNNNNEKKTNTIMSEEEFFSNKL